MWQWLQNLFGGKQYPAERREPIATSFAPPPATLTARPTFSTSPWRARMPDSVLFLDVETTGLATDDRIVSFAGILLSTAALDAGRVELSFGYYVVAPGRKSHPRAREVHGYSDWLLRHQQSFAEIADNVLELWEPADLVVAHNAEFDLRFIHGELTALGRPSTPRPVYCTMEAFRERQIGQTATLDAAAAHIGLARTGQRHGALEDAWLAMMIYLWLHDCPHRFPFTAFTYTIPKNLRPAPPEPSQSEAEGARQFPSALFKRTDAPVIAGSFAPMLKGLDGAELMLSFGVSVEISGLATAAASSAAAESTAITRPAGAQARRAGIKAVRDDLSGGDHRHRICRCSRHGINSPCHHSKSLLRR